MEDADPPHRGELSLTGVPAQAERLVAIRDAVARWLAGIGVPERLRGDIVLATYEAMANVVAHAYPDGHGVFDLRAACDGDSDLAIIVADHGRWRPAHAATPLGGRGLPLIRALAAEHDIATGADGTRVVMRWPLARSAV
jgi:anti-sigma regulatory factor (Ser/Thr protein kinase)